MDNKILVLVCAVILILAVIVSAFCFYKPAGRIIINNYQVMQLYMMEIIVRLS